MNPPIAANSREEREQRLLEIRREAEVQGSVSPRIEPKQTESMQPVTAGASAQTGYYGTPALKRPQWTPRSSIVLFRRRTIGRSLSNRRDSSIVVGGCSARPSFTLAGGHRRPDFSSASHRGPWRTFTFSEHASRFQNSKPHVGGIVDLGCILQQRRGHGCFRRIRKASSEPRSQCADRCIANRLRSDWSGVVHLYRSSDRSHDNPSVERARLDPPDPLRCVRHCRSRGNSGAVGKRVGSAQPNRPWCSSHRNCHGRFD